MGHVGYGRGRIVTSDGSNMSSRPGHAQHGGMQDSGDQPDHQGHGHDDGHGHDHAEALRASPARRLVLALVLTGSFLIVEVIAGLISGSLALLSDAGHMVTDAGALGLALFAQRLAAREQTGQRTFGYRRAEILAALLNGVVLGATAIWIIVEAVRRFRDPPEILGVPMLIVAVLGLVINLLAAWVLSRGGHENANIKAAAAHVLADALGSVAAIMAAVLILTLGWTVADPAVSILISLLILWGSWRLVREAVDVLMEGTPAGIDPDALARAIGDTSGVDSVHDLHVWSISQGFPLVTVHVVLDGRSHGTDVARRVAERIQQNFGIEHVTVQPEAPDTQFVPVSALTEPRD